MTIFSKIGLTSLMLASGVASAYQPAMGWYAGLMGGVSYAPGINFTVLNPLAVYFPPASNFTSLPVKLTYNVLGNGGVQVGYRCDKFRVEGELNFNTNSYNKLQVGPFTIGSNSNIQGLYLNGHNNLYAGFINGFFDIYDEENTDTTWVPYVGLGIGYARVQSSIDFYANFTNIPNPIRNRQIFTAKASTSAPIGQAILGINYFFSDELSIGTDLRYMSTRNIRLLDSRYSVGTWNLVLNYSFDN